MKTKIFEIVSYLPIVVSGLLPLAIGCFLMFQLGRFLEVLANLPTP